jgi:hypothetical protein
MSIFTILLMIVIGTTLIKLLVEINWCFSPGFGLALFIFFALLFFVFILINFPILLLLAIVIGIIWLYIKVC